MEKDHRQSIRELNEFYEILRDLRYEGKMSAGKNLLRARQMTRHFRDELTDHMAQEERVLFPFLRKYIPRLEPMVYLLSSEHKDLRRTLADLKRSFSAVRKTPAAKVGHLADHIYEQGMYLVCLLRSHMSVESRTLYQAADHELRSPERTRLLSLLAHR